ncbi:MAG: protein translocase subunit SecD [Flavobacteriales bacterium]|nr:protein translocase subunit SecD [Flavobacteriales bacterium]MBL0036057.1 protein translocase subunit SecD [Flavobacteriales bacterium]
MQNRGALWVFTILLALACLWQLSFSFFTGRFERKVEAEAKLSADSLITATGKTGLDFDSVKLQFTNKYLRDRAGEEVFLGYSYSDCKEKELNLGLDLKGGMAVTLEVSIPELIDNLSDKSQDPTFRAALKNAREAQRNDNRDFITIFSEEFRKLDPNAKMAAVFHSPDKATMFPREASNDEIIASLHREAEAAINNTEKIIRTRIDKFGVAQPMIQKQALSGRIQVELPGVKDKDRVRKVLQSTANLEFWETFDNTVVFPKIAEANTRLSTIIDPSLAKDSAKTDTGAFNHTLSTNVEITGAGNGVESSLVNFLVSGAAVDKTTWFDFDRVTFQTGSATIDADRSNEQLNNLVEVLKAYPGVRLKIGGYTDNVGNEAANQKLSQQRAEAVVAELVKKGVAADRLEAEGYGSQHAVASNDTEEGRAKNRRMALRVLAVDTAPATAVVDSAKAADDSADVDLADTAAVDTAALRADYAKNNPLFMVLQPNVANNQMMRGDIVGYALPSDTAEVMRLIRMSPPASPDASAGLKLLWSAKPLKMGNAGQERDYLTLHAIKVPRGGKPKLDGTTIVNAAQDFNLKGEAEVVMQMNAEGSNAWSVMTGDNVGKNVAIVLDNSVYSSPVVQSKITGGRSSISIGGGDLSKQIDEASDLANILKAGALPAPARIIDETVVGPSLGEENVTSGLLSFVVALIGVLIVMILYYARAGWIADIALLINAFILIGTMASLGATLTLPGIAGIVLTIGMAVDANVLINERVREELKHGRNLKAAVDQAYKFEGALSAIIDSNVTTLATGIILFIFGSGPIQGFATTLVLGILTSLFTSLFISRLIITRRLEQGKDISFWSGWSKNLFDGSKIDFMGKRKMFYAISGLVIGIGIFSMATRGFNWGVDFTGGRTYVVSFANPVEANDVQAALEPQFRDDGGRQYTTAVKSYGGAKQMKVTTNYLIDQTGTATDSLVDGALAKGLGGLNNTFKVLETRKVDATISDDIQTKAWTSVLFALVFMFIYIAIRFSNWQYGVGALLSLVHDTLFTLGLYSILWGIVGFSLEIDEAFIAVILTVIGYSINDTVVVFDRIREYMHDHKRDPVVTVFNKAINSTLSRTINTGFCTLLVLIIIFFFGGLSIKGFVFGLFFGILVGTYSSIFVASAVAVDLLKDREPATTGKAVTA